jgi:Tfp pilus assembly protein PilV
MELSFVRRRARRAEGGMTLIEVAFAVTITTVGLLALLMMQTAALKQGRWGRHATDAAEIAQDQVEYLMRLPWAHADVQPMGWTAGTAVTRTVTASSGAGPLNYVEQTFTVQQRIATGADPDLRLIDVRVTWNEADQNAGAPVRRYAISTVKKNES